MDGGVGFHFLRFLKENMKSTKVLAFILAMMLLLGGCGKKQAYSKDGKYQIDLPSGWRNMEGELAEAANLEIGSEKKNRYLFALTEKREYYSTFEEFSAVVLYYMQSILEEPAARATEYRELGRGKATMTELMGKMDGQTVCCVVYAAEFEEDYVMLLAWTEYSDFDSKCEAELQAACESFKIKEK